MKGNDAHPAGHHTRGMELGETSGLPAGECALKPESLAAGLDAAFGSSGVAGASSRPAPPPARPLRHVASSDTDKSKATDYELARGSAGGDMAAFEELYSRHHRRVYSLCLRMTQNAAEAEDLTQEVFIQLHRKAGSFRGESQFTTWLHRLTVNQVLMHFRRRGARSERTTDEGEVPVQVVRGTEDPSRMAAVDRIALDKAVGELPPGYRAVFVLHDVEGHEHEEIARMLGCSVGTSKSQLHKARMKLRALLRRQKPPRMVPRRVAE